MKISPNLCYTFCYWLSRILFNLIFWMKVIGRENLPREGGCIIACNHMSYLDPVALGAGCPRQIHYMAKKSLFENRLFAKLITSVNAFAVSESGVGLDAIKESLKRLAEGKVVGVFPEGARSKNGRLKVAKWGVGFLALRSNVPVIPARIIGTGQALPIGAKFIRPRPVRLYFGRPLKFQKDSAEEKRNDYSEVSRLIMKEIGSLGVKVNEDSYS